MFARSFMGDETNRTFVTVRVATRGYGYAVYLESDQDFPGFEQQSKYHAREYSLRLGGWGGSPDDVTEKTYSRLDDAENSIFEEDYPHLMIREPEEF